MKRIVKSIFSFLLPSEVAMLLGIILLLVANSVFTLPLFNPGITSLIGYLGIFVPSLLVCAVIYEYRRKKYKEQINISEIPRNYLTFYFAIYSCMLTKHWAHLATTKYYDDFYQKTDEWLSPLIAIEKKINSLLMIPIDYLQYMTAVQITFFFAFPVCLAGGIRLFNLCSATLVINFIIGGFFYMAAPALGPFIYWSQDKWNATLSKYMEVTQAFIKSAGASYSTTDSIFILGAMPSFHISIPALFSWYMYKSNKFFGVIGALITLYCFVHAQLTGFHYIIDLIAGFALATIAIIIAEKMLKMRESRRRD